MTTFTCSIMPLGAPKGTVMMPSRQRTISNHVDPFAVRLMLDFFQLRGDVISHVFLCLCMTCAVIHVIYISDKNGPQNSEPRTFLQRLGDDR
jgi:hypothetical protein